MGSPIRRVHVYAGSPLTYVSGTTPGEQSISSSTTAPSLVTHGFSISGIDENAGDAQYAAPRFLDVIVELINNGASPDNIQENFSLWFYFPDASTTNKWRESGPFTCSGVNKRGAVGADASEDPASNIFKVDVPRGATRCFVHFPSLTASIKAVVLAYADN